MDFIWVCKEQALLVYYDFRCRIADEIPVIAACLYRLRRCRRSLWPSEADRVDEIRETILYCCAVVKLVLVQLFITKREFYM